MLSRRTLLFSSLSLAAMATAPPAFSARLVRTPRQTRGPFYPRELPLDRDNDLVRVKGRRGRAEGVIAHVGGRVLAEDGRPVDGVRVEIWQCDARGVYHHVGRGYGADPNFQGYGHGMTDGEGAYRFRTIKPVPYPGRAPHIHFAVSGPGVEPLVTQMYVAGEPLNARDGLLNYIGNRRQRASVIVDFEAAPDIEPGAVAGVFDIVMGLNA